MKKVSRTVLILIGSALQLWSQPITWKRLVPNIAHDQKRIWTFPLQLAQGKRRGQVLAVSGVTTGLVFADPVVAPYFRDNRRSLKTFNSILGTNYSALATVLSPIGLYLAGSIAKDTYAKETALLTAETVANVQVLSLVMHTVDRRTRPKQLPAGSNYGKTWFQHDLSFKGSGSFPSGHTMTAFAAYGLAGVVSFSRITTSSHFLSDVFFGAALGYTVGRLTVPVY